ncbi:hypothetical protein H1Q59_00515 [Holosporaceae bacterium 'Namur']|nr:hypothetical protein [Holosporaceae bacterium 'Namur']
MLKCSTGYYLLQSSRNAGTYGARWLYSWLITADKGIKVLSEVIGFVVNENNPMSPLAGRFIDKEVYNSSEYWHKCDEMYNNLTSLRLKMSSRCSQEEMYSQLHNCVKQLEKAFLAEKDL